MSRDGDDEVIRKRSALAPATLAVLAIVLLSAALLLYYLTPGWHGPMQEQIAPTSDTNKISVTINGQKFRIPANYFEYESERKGGSRTEVFLFAHLPDLNGWTSWQADDYADNLADSPAVFLTIHEDGNNLSDRERLARIYMGYVKDRRGTPGPYGLREYKFRPDAGYRDEDLFVGSSEGGPVILRCVRLSAEAPSPNCLSDTLIAKGVGLSYRFKRARLADWQDIDATTKKLIVSFMRKKKK